MNHSSSDTTGTQNDWLDALTWAAPIVAFLAALLLILHSTYIPSLREPFSIVRWVPFVALVGYVGLMLRVESSGLRRFYWFDLCIIGFVGLAVSSAVYSIAPVLTVPRAFSVALIYVAVFWGLWAAVDRVGPSAIISALVYAGTLVFVLLYISLPFLNWEYATSGNRLRSFLENANTVGLLVAFLLPLVLLKSIETQRWVWHAAAALLLVSLVLSQSRTGLGATLLGTAYFLYHALPNRRKLVAGAIAVYILVNLVWIQVVFGGGRPAFAARITLPLEAPLYAEKLERGIAYFGIEDQTAGATPQSDRSQGAFLGRLSAWRTNPRIRDLASLGGRIPVWNAGLRYLMSRPLLGYGYGTEELIMRLHGFPEASYGNRFHNAFLGMALQVGVAGALMFYAPLFALIWTESRSRVSYTAMPERFALRAVAIIGLASALFESSLYAVGNVFTFLFWTSVMLLGRMVIGEQVPAPRVSRPQQGPRWRFSLKGHFNAEIGWRDESGEKRLEARIDANM